MTVRTHNLYTDMRQAAQAPFESSISQRVRVLMFALACVAIWLYAFTSGQLLMAGLIAVAIFVAVFSHPPLGMALFLVATPFGVVDVAEIGLSPFVLWTGTFVFALSVQSVLVRGLSTKHRAEDVFFVLFLVSLLLAVVVTSRRPDLGTRALVSIVLQVWIVVICLDVIRRYPDGFSWLLTALLVMGAIAAPVAIRGGTNSRLGLGDQEGAVRVLSNALAFTFVAAITIYVCQSNVERYRLRVPRIPRLMLGALIVLVPIAVALTVSRGVLVTLIATAAAFALLQPWVKSRKAAGLFVFFLVAVVSIAVAWSSLNVITGGVLERRVAATFTQLHGVSIRLQIWQGGFEGFTPAEWIFGAGPGTYRSTGTGAYPHSSYISMLHDGGVVGMLFFLAIIVHWTLVAKAKGRLAIFLPIAVFQLLLNATYGSISSKYFWIGVILLGAVARSPVRLGAATARSQPGRARVGNVAYS